MKIKQFIDAIETIAPTRYAESWDNVGLLVGDAKQDVTRALLCIDYTPAIAAEAVKEKCDLVIAYHPVIFKGIQRVLADRQNVVFDAIRRGIAIYSPHTALDVADGGTNDLLADAIGIAAETRRPLRLIDAKAAQCKLVTFVPEKDLDRVASALFDAGAGRIGNYTQCSFRLAGTGTFYGEEGATNPAVGQSGKLETAAEIRLETVTPIDRLTEVVAALRASHPYEEPAFDLVQLAAAPEKLGQGRLGKLAAPAPRHQVIERIKRELGLNQLLVAGPTEGKVTIAACCAGSCGDFVDDAMTAGADLFLTGELRHHDALKAAAAGMTVVCTLHSNSERAVLKRLSQRLGEALPDLQTIVSQFDRDPFAIA